MTKEDMVVQLMLPDSTLMENFIKKFNGMTSLTTKWEFLDKLDVHALKRVCVQSLSYGEVAPKLYQSLAERIRADKKALAAKSKVEKAGTVEEVAELQPLSEMC